MQAEDFLWAAILPPGLAEDFAIKQVEKKDDELEITLEEKNNIPYRTEEQRKKGVISKGFQTIRLNDFPVRGRACIIILKRRVWQVKGEKTLLTNNYEFEASHTKLIKEFGDFLKE